MLATKRMGIFTVGGEFAELVAAVWRLCGIAGTARLQELPLKRYKLWIADLPEPVHWGGLSGSTYTEAVSWGKFVPPEEGGKFAEIFEDATVRCHW